LGFRVSVRGSAQAAGFMVRVRVNVRVRVRVRVRVARLEAMHQQHGQRPGRRRVLIHQPRHLHR
jgi:hypothetical protein